MASFERDIRAVPAYSDFSYLNHRLFLTTKRSGNFA
jgi:hypothetical protein